MHESLPGKAQLCALAFASVCAMVGCSQKEEIKIVPATVTGAASASVPATASVAPVQPTAPISAALKIAFVYLGPVGDGGASYTQELGRKALEARFGDRIKTTFAENVPEGAASERIFRELAGQGTALIFGTSATYADTMLKVAKDFPNVKFELVEGAKTADNLGLYGVRTYEGAFLAGIVAGKMSKSGKIGVIAALPNPAEIRNINAFVLGAQNSNPKILTRVVAVNQGFDPAKEREAALALIEQGADVLLATTDSPASVEAAEEKGAYAIGWMSDRAKVGPKAQLASVTVNWLPYYSKVVTDMLAGNWKSDDTGWGVKEEAITLDNVSTDLPPEVKTLLDEKTAALKEGTLAPFQGPIVDQAGKKILPAGKSLDGKALKGMNFYIKGIDGAIPK